MRDKIMIKRATFENMDDVEFGISELSKIEPRFLEAVTLSGVPKIRKSGVGFESVFKTIVGQQLSTSAANSIWNKLSEKGVTLAPSLLSSKNTVLRGLGLSNTKIAYAKGLALAEIDYDEFLNKSDDYVIEKLVAVKGIGLWTAQIYLMFSLRRVDVFASGDLALKEGVRILFDLEIRPSHDELTAIAELWKPFRTIAAMIIWNYYGHMKRRKG
jgi:DNA-3-methyladenine glycosylase II